jgi:hypothetical protein
MNKHLPKEVFRRAAASAPTMHDVLRVQVRHAPRNAEQQVENHALSVGWGGAGRGGVGRGQQRWEGEATVHSAAYRVTTPVDHVSTPVALPRCLIKHAPEDPCPHDCTHSLARVSGVRAPTRPPTLSGTPAASAHKRRCSRASARLQLQSSAGGRVRRRRGRVEGGRGGANRGGWAAFAHNHNTINRSRTTLHLGSLQSLNLRYLNNTQHQ